MDLSKLRFIPIPAVLGLVAYLAYDNRDTMFMRQRPAGVWQHISAGGEHTCALDREQKISCWGKSSGGRTTPPRVKLTGISAGGAHSCGLTEDGEAVCWGEDYKGSTRPPPGPFRQLSAGWDYTCAIKKDRTLACWGDNGTKQAAPPAGTFKQVSAGTRHTCGVRDGGAVVCWGEGQHGQGTAPTGTFKQVVVGKCHSCGLLEDGSVKCWGCNPPDQYSPDGRYTPPDDLFTQISAGLLHLCGLRGDGTVDCWGHNALGESNDPKGVFRQVTAGYFHTCGLRTDGVVTCWGWASHTTRPQADKLEAREIVHDSVALQGHTCPYEGLGLLYLGQGREDRAAGHFEMAVQVSPNREPRQYIHLARLRINKGRLAEAEKLLKKATTLSEHQGEIRRLLERIQKIRGGGKDKAGGHHSPGAVKPDKAPPAGR